MRSELARDLRTRRFWRQFGVQAFAAVGFCAVFIGIIAAIFPKAAPDMGVPLAVTVLLTSVLYGCLRAWPHPIEQSYDSPNVVVRVTKGDLFTEPEHLVIGMTDTFDTEVPHVIDKKSLQAQFVDRVFNGDTTAFEGQLTEALQNVQPVGSVRKAGKQAKYPLGTVATLREPSRRFFCLAYTEMNERNEARASVDGLWRSLSCLWKAVCAHANGGTVSIPVIGGGQARISQVLPAQDSIRFIAMSFILASRNEKVCDELNIIVLPQDYDALDRLEIQAFLKSLRPS